MMPAHQPSLLPPASTPLPTGPQASWVKERRPEVGGAAQWKHAERGGAGAEWSGAGAERGGGGAAPPQHTLQSATPSTAMPARAVVAGGGGAGGVSSAALPARSPALPASAPVPAVAERCFQGLHGVGAGAAVGGGGQGGNAQMGGHAAASGSLKRGRDDGSPDSSGLTKVQRDKIALADMVLAADKIIRECFSKEDQHEQGGFRYVQPISDLARGVVEKRLPFGCPEMIRLAVIARNLDPVITQAKSIRFTTQFKLTTWEGSLHSLKGSSARVVYDVRRGRQDPSDTSTTSVFQLFKTGELLPSIASLERFVSIQAKKASEAPP